MSRAVRIRLLAAAALWMLLPLGLPAVQTQLARTDTYDELAPGELHGVSLSHLGRLMPAPEIRQIYRADAEIFWSIAVAPDGRVFYGSGHSGKIFMTDRKSSGSLFLDLKAPEATALHFHKNGQLYVGTSPDGKLLVCDKPGTATLVFETGEKYIWDLAADAAGNLIVATGPKGKIFKVNPDKRKGELLFDAPDDNVLSLAFDPKGRLHAATQGKGRVYRWDEDRTTTPVVIFEAADDEVRRIAIDPKGNVFAAVNSEVMARRAASAMASLGGASASASARPPEGPSGSGPEPSRPPTPPPAAGRSEIFLIDTEGFVRSLWRVSEAPTHSMIYDEGRDSVLIGAGNKGKLFRLDTKGNYSIVLSVREEQIHVLRAAGKQVFLATGGPTLIHCLGEGLSRRGEYLSPAINANASVRWGTLRRDGSGVDAIEIETRSGNTKEPDTTWYDWAPVRWSDGPKDGKIQSPVARYLQWRAKWNMGRAATDRPPELDLVEVFYAPDNVAPQIRRIEIKKAGSTGSPPSRPPDMPPASPTSLAAMMAGGGPGAPPSGSAPSTGRDFQVAENSNPKRFDITWQVSDPNNDPLESALYFKAEDEKTWKLIEEKLAQARFTFDTSSLPDGVYRIKVVVTDRLANFAPNIRSDEMVSDLWIVDNTPPQIEKTRAYLVRDGDKTKWRVTARATDAVSIIAGAKYNVDGGKWQVLVPTDGLFDDRSEAFEFDVTELKDGGEHVVGLIVTDREGNSTVDKVLLRP
ncbi:MAG: hypothetical protein N3D11_02475 [Candidatus Sumerlaeia bacterium]|nr:hypothetical protein [Candidatus Sumerlaeia bacterium]